MVFSVGLICAICAMAHLHREKSRPAGYLKAVRPAVQVNALSSTLVMTTGAPIQQDGETPQVMAA